MNALWNWRVLPVVLAVAICCALTRRVKAQTPYTYTVIADLFNCFAKRGARRSTTKGRLLLERIADRQSAPPAARSSSCGETAGPDDDLRGDDHSCAAAPDVVSINDSGVVAFAVNGGCRRRRHRDPHGGWGSDGNRVRHLHRRGVYDSSSALNQQHRRRGVRGGFREQLRLRVTGQERRTRSDRGPGHLARGHRAASGGVRALDQQQRRRHIPWQPPGHRGGVLFTGAGGALTIISQTAPSIFNAIDDSGRVAFVAGVSPFRPATAGQ